MGESGLMVIDEIYEFSAPRFYDFINGETEEEREKAQLWFESAISYGPSPCTLRIKTGRAVQLGSLCDFNEADDHQPTKAAESCYSANPSTYPLEEVNLETPKDSTRPEPMPIETSKDVPCSEKSGVSGQNNYSSGQIPPLTETSRKVAEETPTEYNSVSADIPPEEANLKTAKGMATAKQHGVAADLCTPKPPTISTKRNLAATASKKQLAKKIASLVKDPSALKTRNHSQLSQAKTLKPTTVKRETIQKISGVSPNLAQENQAIKRQKLDEGKTRQILNIKPHTLLHKSRPGPASTTTCSSAAPKTRNEDRTIYVREPAKKPAPFVSTAELMKKFQSSTRAMSLPQSSIANGKPKLTLTRPKEPEFETSQRVRSTRAKSSAELEEEMMAKMPKFKARPLNKKIFEGPTLPSIVPKSIPRPPEFQEFHLETMARASKNAELSSVVSTESSGQNNQWKPRHLTDPKTPVLQTSLRARPTVVKSSLQIEEEELEKIPKFKARPFNKKIFESKGDMGLFCNSKKQVTIPQEFHFAIDERIPPPQPPQLFDLFDKLSLTSESSRDHYVPRNTRPNPFHLHTEERGMEKERRFFTELLQKQIEEERSRVPKANPYPYTTDYPVVPPKPEPKHCTKPEPFQLESLVRHEEEMKREMEERQTKEREEAQMRMFKAQPLLKEDPIPVPEKERRPLTQVQEFNLHAEHRAVDRAEFDKKVKEKEMKYKRYREEAEAAKMMEEEKALKHLRRTLVPHAKPVPNFANPFMPQKSNRVTKPKSPKLRIHQRKSRFSTATASSSFTTTSPFPR